MEEDVAEKRRRKKWIKKEKWWRNVATNVPSRVIKLCTRSGKWKATEVEGNFASS